MKYTFFQPNFKNAYSENLFTHLLTDKVCDKFYKRQVNAEILPFWRPASKETIF